MSGVLVVGGGISGLAAAHALAAGGIAVTLVEAGPRLGGKVATEHVDGFAIEAGADSFLATRPAAVTLARDLGLGEELIGTSGVRTVYIRHRGRLVRMPEGMGLVLPTRLLPFARTPLFSPAEKLRMAKDLVWPRTLAPGDTAVGSFLRARLGPALVERLAAPLVGGVYGTPIDELSLDAVVPALRLAERDHRSLLLAGLADGRRLSRAAATRPAGEASLGAFASLRGGMGELVTALEHGLGSAGVTVRTETAVGGLARAGAGVGARFGDGSMERFDAAVVATPAPVAARLLAAEVPGATRVLDSIPHGTATVVTLGYARERVGHELAGHGYLVPPVEGGPISASTWTSEKWRGRAPEGAVLLRMFVRDDGTSAALPDDTLVAVARADAERTLSIAGPPLLARVTRWTGSMPRYAVGHLARVAAIDEAMTAWPNVVVAGASYRGIGLPDCITQAQAAAARVATRLGARPAVEEPSRCAPADHPRTARSSGSRSMVSRSNGVRKISTACWKPTER